MNRLVRLHASNLLKPDTILAAEDNLSLLSFASSGQLSDENIGVGDCTWAYISGLEDLKPFFCAVRNFYVATLKKMLNMFPFADSILKDLILIKSVFTLSVLLLALLNDLNSWV